MKPLHELLWDFPGGSDGKASAYNAGDPGSIPGSGRSSGEGNGNPLQYSCLENPMDRGAWWATVHGVTKSQTQLSDFSSLQNWFLNLSTQHRTHGQKEWRFKNNLKWVYFPGIKIEFNELLKASWKCQKFFRIILLTLGIICVLYVNLWWAFQVFLVVKKEKWRQPRL